jgi:hypothetical protein
MIGSTACIPKLGSLAEWDFYPADSGPKRWANELLAIAADPSADPLDWDIAGRGVLVETDDGDRAADVIAHVAKATGFRLVTIPREDVSGAFEKWMGGFTNPTGLLEPTMLFLQPGMWMVAANEDLRPSLQFSHEAEFDTARAAVFRRLLARFMEENIVDRPLIIVTAVKAVAQLDEKLRRARIFDRRIGLPDLEPEVFASAFVHSIGPEILSEGFGSDLKRLGSFLKHEFEHDRRRLGLVQVAMHRIHRRDCRKITFRDMLELAIYGTLEGDGRRQDGDLAWRTSVHEAGHVLVRYLTTNRRVVPEYCGITGRGGMLGITVDCYSTPYLEAGEQTWQDMVADVRFGLGGRAAEQVVLGIRVLSAAGSKSDLERVTSLARTMIEDFGLPLDDSTESAADHLMVSSGPLAASECGYNEPKIRDFLRHQYQHCVDLLNQNRNVLICLAEELHSRIILEQHEIRVVLESVGLYHQSLQLGASPASGPIGTGARPPSLL